MAEILPAQGDCRTARSVWIACASAPLFVSFVAFCLKILVFWLPTPKPRGDGPALRSFSEGGCPSAIQFLLSLGPFAKAIQVYLRLIKATQAKIKIVIFLRGHFQSSLRLLPLLEAAKKPLLQNEPNFPTSSLPLCLCALVVKKPMPIKAQSTAIKGNQAQSSDPAKRIFSY